MSKKRKKKNKGSNILLGLIKFVATVMVIGVLAWVFWDYTKDKVMSALGEKVMEYTLEQQASQYGIPMEKVDEVLENIDDADKDVLENIVANHMDGDTISKGMEYAQDGDTSGLKEFISEELTDTEVGELMEIYEKYKDTVSAEEMAEYVSGQ